MTLEPRTDKLAFLDVDTQVDFMLPGGKLYAQGAEAIRANLGRLVQHARAEGIPLVSCVDAHAPDDPEFQSWPPHCLRGTPGQAKLPETLTGAEVFVPNAPAERLPDPRRAHVVLEKQETMVFTNQQAERVLRATGADEVVVFGVVTEVCVRQAAEGLLARGFKVRLVEDAIWPLDREQGEATLRALEAKGAVRTTTDQVLGVGAGAGA